MEPTLSQCLLVSETLFAICQIGLVGVIVRRNLLIICMPTVCSSTWSLMQRSGRAVQPWSQRAHLSVRGIPHPKPNALAPVPAGKRLRIPAYLHGRFN